MLRPSDERAGAHDDSDRPIGELVQELIEDGKAYARAEADVVRAILTSKVKAAKTPSILFGTALLLLLAAVVGLAVGVALALATLIGPLAGGFVTFLLFAAVAGALGWFGARRLREDL